MPSFNPEKAIADLTKRVAALEASTKDLIAAKQKIDELQKREESLKSNVDLYLSRYGKESAITHSLQTELAKVTKELTTLSMSAGSTKLFAEKAAQEAKASEAKQLAREAKEAALVQKEMAKVVKLEVELTRQAAKDTAMESRLKTLETLVQQAIAMASAKR